MILPRQFGMAPKRQLYLAIPYSSSTTLVYDLDMVGICYISRLLSEIFQYIRQVASLSVLFQAASSICNPQSFTCGYACFNLNTSPPKNTSYIKMQSRTQILLAILFIMCYLSATALAQVDLGTAAPFGIVATSEITNTGATVIDGELGLYPNTLTSITGFPPGMSGIIHAADGVADQAHKDANTAYNAAAALALTADLTGQDLGGKTLVAGTYHFSSSVGITGPLTLDGQDNPNSLFVFQIGSTLTTATASSVVLINGAKACNVFWQVGSSATLGTTTIFVGNILASASIALNSGVTVNGGLYALTGAVTLIDDQVTAPQSCAVQASSSSIGVSSSPTSSSVAMTTTTSSMAPTMSPATSTPITSLSALSSTSATSIPISPLSTLSSIPATSTTISPLSTLSSASATNSPGAGSGGAGTGNGGAGTGAGSGGAGAGNGGAGTGAGNGGAGTGAGNGGAGTGAGNGGTGAGNGGAGAGNGGAGTGAGNGGAGTGAGNGGAGAGNGGAGTGAGNGGAGTGAGNGGAGAGNGGAGAGAGTGNGAGNGGAGNGAGNGGANSSGVTTGGILTTTLPILAQSSSSFSLNSSAASASSNTTAIPTISTERSSASSYPASASSHPTSVFTSMMLNSSSTTSNHTIGSLTLSTSPAGSKASSINSQQTTSSPELADSLKQTYPCSFNSSLRVEAITYTSGGVQHTSTILIPCRTSTYYESTCSCTKTKIFPISTTAISQIAAASNAIVTISGIPCTTSTYYEASCACTKTTLVPITSTPAPQVAAVGNAVVTVNGVPCTTSTYYEKACDCVKTMTMPIATASAGGASVVATAVSAISQTSQTLASCIAACMSPWVPTITESFTATESCSAMPRYRM